MYQLYHGPQSISIKIGGGPPDQGSDMVGGPLAERSKYYRTVSTQSAGQFNWFALSEDQLCTKFLSA